MAETKFINLRLILEKVKDSRYQAKLEHESKPNPQPVEFDFALKDQISGEKSFLYYFNDRIATLKAKEEELEIVGKALYDLVFKEDLGATFQAWYRDLTRNEIFRLRLDIQAPELISVPWELLRDHQDFLARRGVSIVRFMGNARKDDVELDSGMKMLIVSASPKNNSFDEKSYIQPVQSLFEKEGIKPDILMGAEATRQNLLNKLDDNKYDLFHFVGHGAFEKGKGKVLLVDQQRNSESIRGNELSDWLWRSGVKFAFFCSCQTGITSEVNTFNGVAHSMVGSGIPAVVAMQYNFPQEEARTMVESFYNKLLKSENIDEAMRFARRILGYEELSWCIPVLYSQFDIGRLVKSEFKRDIQKDKEQSTGLEVPTELTQEEKQLFRTALRHAFPNRVHLAGMIEDELYEELDTITYNEPDYKIAVRNLVKWAETEGRLKDLLEGALRKKPGNPKLKELKDLWLSSG